MEEPYNPPLYPTERQARERGVPDHLIGVYQQQAYRLAFGLMTWYERLRDHTFSTHFVELEHSDMLALLHAARDPDAARPAQGLEERLDKALREWPGGAFVKLETRSPKDVPMNVDGELSARVLERAVAVITGLQGSTGRRRLSDSVVLDTVMKEAYACLRVTTGAEALQLLCTSRRVQEDIASLARLFDYGVRANINVRRWDEEVVRTPEREFRGFVYKNKLNALSQYDYLSHYAEVVAAKDDIAGRVCQFFDSVVAPALTDVETYVIDFWVGRDRILIIELNSFESWTGACLFTWHDDVERFRAGPFQFRVVESSTGEDTRYAIPVRWQRVLDERTRCFTDEEAPPSWCRFL